MRRFTSLCLDSHDFSNGLEEALMAACQQLSAPDQAVLSHVRITKYMLSVSENDTQGNEKSNSLLEKLMNEVESFLIHNAGRASVCRQWPLLPILVQRRIKEAAPAALYSRYAERGSGTLPPQPHRPRLGSLGSKGSAVIGRPRLSTFSDSNKLARSASASNVPPLHAKQVTIIISR